MLYRNRATGLPLPVRLHLLYGNLRTGSSDRNRALPDWRPHRHRKVRRGPARPAAGHVRRPHDDGLALAELAPRRPAVQVEKWATEKKVYEKTHGEPLPVLEGWKKFNANFDRYFTTDVPAAQGARAGRADAGRSRKSTCTARAKPWRRCFIFSYGTASIEWRTPSGIRAESARCSAGLDVQESAHSFSRRRRRLRGHGARRDVSRRRNGTRGLRRVLQDRTASASSPRRTHSSASTPRRATSASGIANQMDIDFEVEDIRNLKYGREFDIVVSIGLIEHFPDEHKGLAFEFHRRFLKPGGYVILTTPRDQLRTPRVVSRDGRRAQLWLSRADDRATRWDCTPPKTDSTCCAPA